VIHSSAQEQAYFACHISRLISVKQGISGSTASMFAVFSIILSISALEIVSLGR
jgi:hypothetical protein